MNETAPSTRTVVPDLLEWMGRAFGEAVERFACQIVFCEGCCHGHVPRWSREARNSRRARSNSRFCCNGLVEVDLHPKALAQLDRIAQLIERGV